MNGERRMSLSNNIAAAARKYPLMIAVMAGTSFSAMPSPLKAEETYHGHGHSELHHWYRRLMRPDFPSYRCCNDQDCRPTRARWNKGHWEAQKDGRWIRIPNEKISREQSIDSRPHICAPPTSHPKFHADYVFCFVKPGPGS